MKQGKLGILVGGGPAPGINGVISSVTIKARREGLEVIGIYDGFKWLSQGDITQVKPLQVEEVDGIFGQGGSVLRTSRENPAKSETAMQKVTGAIRQLGLDYLVTIGGDDTAYSSSKVATVMEALRVAHVPKTIDNDLPLPDNAPTFGFHTACHVGAGLVRHLLEDAHTTGRWYVIVTMGRKSGSLTLGIGQAAGATLSIIPEEFPDGPIVLEHVCDILEGAILKRRTAGRPDGVALVAEGLAERLAAEELKGLPGVEVSYDPHGHLRLHEVPLAKVLTHQIEERFARRSEQMSMIDLDLGYELRCAHPIAFDRGYVRSLGWGAVQYLLSPEYAGGAIICLDFQKDRTRPLLFTDMLDEKGRTRVRMVDVRTQSYQVMRDYMTRLEKKDLEDPDMLARLARAAGLSPEELRRHFAALG